MLLEPDRMLAELHLELTAPDQPAKFRVDRKQDIWEESGENLSKGHHHYNMVEFSIWSNTATSFRNTSN